MVFSKYPTVLKTNSIYIGQVDRHKTHSPYLLSVYFLFRNIMFSIWTIYAAIQDKTILYDALEKLKKKWVMKLREKSQTI
ncbi:hypothetical protein RhiirA5_431738 [Rhizophagus irregularis]|uniref:Uncharacterized protein n=1 Tax=Rhizophagus irregularis TaxID=588596 RepID=A0A2N0NUG3_9GLOM|nr:hypothetical protein RhiirA5_431738 [Rhizophagus irregularis]